MASKLRYFVSRPILIPALLALISVIFIVYSMFRLVDDVENFTAKEHAAHIVDSIGVLRTYYSKKLLANVRKEHDVVVSPDYLTKPGELPPPARLAIDFAKELSASDSDVSVRLISRYPFPWRLEREGMEFDQFEEDALDYLNENPAQTYFRLEKDASGKTLRYAEPIVMGDSCVTCHNTHPDSPKTDWKVGDLRGINEVSINLTNLEQSIENTILYSFLIVSGLLTLSLMMLHFSLRGMKTALNDARGKAVELDAINKNLEGLVEERTKEVTDKNAELSKSLENLKQAQVTIITQEKMASLGQMTAGVAHEIKNPLNFIKNFSEISSDISEDILEITEKVANAKAEDDDITELRDLCGDLSDNCKKISEHSVRVDNIVKSMLMHSREGSSSSLVSDINDIVQQTYNLVHHGQRLDKHGNLSVNFDLTKSLSNIEIYPNEFGRVLLNIMNNAIYAVLTKEETADEDFSPSIVITTKDHGETCSISIHDNGSGIDKEHIEKIFNPFFTTKPTNVGTGLGLSMSYDIVTKMHHGKLEVNSEKGEFTEFVITIPKVQPALDDDDDV